MICSKCGSEIEEGELFCGNCGTPVSKENAAPENTESSGESEKQSSAGKSEKQASAGGSEKSAEKKWSKTPVIISVVIIWLLLMAGIFFLLYSIVMKASTIRLSSYTGDVTLTSDTGRNIEVKEDKRLFGGNELKTGKESKAWVLLDEDRMVTVMERSTVDFYQSGKSIKLNLEKGNLFFNIARDLGEDESFEIATSTMVIGIRGTSGYVRESEDGYPVLYLTSGKVMVYVEDPDSGEDDQRKVKAGQKLTVIMTDDGPEIIVEDITEYDLPEDALFEITGDDDLLDEVVGDAGWDKDILLNLKDVYDGQITGDEGDSETVVAEGAAAEIVGIWHLDPELSESNNVVERTLTFNDDLTGSAYYVYEDSVEEFDFTWKYIDVTAMVSIDCEDDMHDAGLFYEDGRLYWLSNVFCKEGTETASAPEEPEYDLVGRYEPVPGQDTDILYFEFYSDGTGLVETLVGGGYHDIQVEWYTTDVLNQYHARIAPAQTIIGLERSRFDVDVDADGLDFYGIRFVRT